MYDRIPCPGTAMHRTDEAIHNLLNDIRIVSDDSDSEDDDDNDCMLANMMFKDGADDFRQHHALHQNSLDLLRTDRLLPTKPFEEELDPTESSSCSFFDAEGDDTSISDGEEIIKPVTRRVSFGTVQIREYACIVGDHPLCRDACPLTLDWKYCDDAHDAQDLESFECKRFLLRRSVPRRLDLEQRRDRIKETNDDMTASKLQDLELDVAMTRLQQSITNANDFWNEREGSDADQKARSWPAGIEYERDDSNVITWERVTPQATPVVSV